MQNNRELEIKAASSSLVQSFTIRGLYGYREISMSSPYAATVMIARNGAGKTTLIGALYAVLMGQFSRLNNLDFSEIRCNLSGLNHEVVIRRPDLDAYFNIPTDSSIGRMAERAEVNINTLFSFVVEEFPTIGDDYRVLRDHPIYSALERATGYRTASVRKAIEEMRNDDVIFSSPLHKVRQDIRELLSGYDVIYLPTYRRIELPLAPDIDNAKMRRRKAPFPQPTTNLLAGDINFGLGDISDRLSELNRRILFESNDGYRKISADIISEMIEHDLDATQIQETPPNSSELTMFLARLKESSLHDPFIGEVSLPNIDRALEASSKQTDTGRFLRYFLGKLNTVIQATRDVELRVQDFIENCNKYLSSQDPSTTLYGEESKKPISPTPDDKALRLNKKNLSVHAESLVGKRRISLNALSSGEKQMVSLFAKLYLYEKPKLVLIDEPEISLSIDWQRQILVDVLAAPLCEQVIAITHSPFTFENALDSFARALQVKVDLDALPPASDDEYELDE